MITQAVRWAALAALCAALSACASRPEVIRDSSGSSGRQLARSADCGPRYTVRRGDTLSAIAQNCDVRWLDLAAENNLSAPYTLRDGQVLVMPGGARTYTVRRGDNLYRVAVSHGMSLQELASINGIPAPYTIYPGQELQLSGSARPVQQAAVTPPPAPAQRPAPASTPPPAAVSQPSQPAAGAPAFRWPHDGEVIANFGSQPGGRRNDGIKIAASVGEPVRAAAAGEVVYAGNELQGYGELVLLRHGDWVTAYAHNSVLRVSVGQQVEAGAVIAEAGSSGSANRVQVHFEIRRGVTPVDPMQHLPRR
ncbi:MAG: lipoprotein NlpD [Oceanicaulis sp. HLUCCA04]|nr:MAG: lipoprotein NlpD [Oceanicaulis sp. HLUCCA04]